MKSLFLFFHVSRIFMFRDTAYLSNFLYSLVKITLWKQENVTEHKMKVSKVKLYIESGAFLMAIITSKS